MNIQYRLLNKSPTHVIQIKQAVLDGVDECIDGRLNRGLVYGRGSAIGVVDDDAMIVDVQEDIEFILIFGKRVIATISGCMCVAGGSKPQELLGRRGWSCCAKYVENMMEFAAWSEKGDLYVCCTKGWPQ